MRTPVELDRLVAAARAWEGTPFCAGAAVRGRGVCCHRLVHEILIEAGWLPRIEAPAGSPVWGAAANHSLMEAWFDGPGAEWFASVPCGSAEPGDVLGCRLGRCVHHLALLLPGGAVAQAVAGSGASIIPAVPQAWSKRLARVWRVR